MEVGPALLMIQQRHLTKQSARRQRETVDATRLPRSQSAVKQSMSTSQATQHSGISTRNQRTEADQLATHGTMELIMRL